MTTMTRDTMAPEMEVLKTRLRATWMAGDYGYFARYLEPGALEFLARLPVAPGMRMLDVACGAGQIAIPAARAGARVTGIDIAASLIDQARSRARAEHLDVRFDDGDAEMLPYEDGAFDLVVSLIGAMFAPSTRCAGPQRAAPRSRAALGPQQSRGQGLDVRKGRIPRGEGDPRLEAARRAIRGWRLGGGALESRWPRASGHLSRLCTTTYRTRSAFVLSPIFSSSRAR